VFNIGSQELLIILLLVFVLFGPRHIPGVARALGKGFGDVQRAMRGMEDHMRRAAEEIPRVTDVEPLDPVPSAPKILPVAGSVEAPPSNLPADDEGATADRPHRGP